MNAVDVLVLVEVEVEVDEEVEVDGTKHIASELMDDLVYQWFEEQ